VTTDWKAGDIAICIDTKGYIDGNPPPLRLNAEYVVSAVTVCECGTVKLDVGICASKGTTCHCGAKSSPTSGIWWCYSKRFVKKETKHESDAIIEKILQTQEED
jgi:hypothetical protein